MTVAPFWRADAYRPGREPCLCLDIQRASRAIGRHFDEAFRPIGLTNWQFSLLMVIDRRHDAPIGTLAIDLGSDRTTLTGNLKPLERRGLVTVRTDMDDRRRRCVRLTDDGTAVLAEARRLWRAAHDAALDNLDAYDLGAFRGALRTVAGV